MVQKVKVGGQFNGTINFAMQQNYVPVIRYLVVSNITGTELENIKLKISFEPQFARDYESVIARLLPNVPVEIAPIKIVLSPDYLLSVTEKIVGNIRVELFEGEESIYMHDDTIELLAYDEWAGLLLMPEIISAFVTPNHPKIKEIIAKASTYLKRWTGDPAFTGYQTNNSNVVKKQMAAIYAALQAENIAYNMPPASYEAIGQRVRLPHAVLEQKTGTCLDLSVLYASCLEAVGLHSLLVFIKGHAFTGCWLEEDTFPECVQDDVSAMTKRLASGIVELTVVECTDFVAGKSVDFDRAEKHANDHFLNPMNFQMAIDIMRSRGSGIRPIPIRVEEDGHYVMADYGKRKSGDITSAPKLIDLKYNGVTAKAGEVTKQKIWERKLLDLSLRNTLLSFRVTKNAVQLMASDLSTLEDELAKGEDFKILPRPADWVDTLKDTKIFEVENEKDLIEAIAQAEFKRKRIRTFVDENELDKCMKSLHHQAKLSLEENGANTLYLALGFLRWFESDLSEKPRYAPIVLVPIDVIRKVQDKSYIIRLRDEEPQMNITLLEMLRQDYGINIAGLDPLPADENGIDLHLIFNTMRQGVMAKNRWDIEEFSFIGLFSFSQFIMWNDIRNRADDLLKNKVVSSLISGKMEWTPLDDCLNADELDLQMSPMDMAVPASADSSQLVAVCAAARGQSFVLHGPPGTGKSQTITNMIANALYQGKSVLFVAEKMAALTVVQKRLEAIGLAPFCLELHSNKAQKKNVLEQLERTLQVGQIKKPEDYEETAGKLHELRTTLNDVMNEIHKNRSYGMSLYDAITKYENYIGYSGKVKFSADTVSKVSGDTFTQWKDILNRYKIAVLECGGIKASPFRLFEGREYSMELRNSIRDTLQQYKEILKDLQTQGDKIFGFLAVAPKTAFGHYMELCNVCRTLSGAEYISIAAVSNNDLHLADAYQREVISNGMSKVNIEKQLTVDFDKAVFNYDFQTAALKWRQTESKWFLPKWIEQNKLLKEIKLYAKNPKLLKKAGILKVYQLLITHAENCKFIGSADVNAIEQFGAMWNNGNPDWELLAKTYADSRELNRSIMKLAKEKEERTAVLDKIAEAAANLAAYKNGNELINNAYEETVNRLTAIEKHLQEEYKIRVEILHADELWMDAAGNLAERMLANIDGLKSWTTFLNIQDEARNAGLSEIIAAHLEGVISEEEILPSYECNLSYAIINAVMSGNEILSKFQGAQFEETIAKYKEVLKDFEILTIKELVSRLSAKIPRTSANMANSSEIGILQKAIKSGGRMMSIRKLFDSIPALLRRLCPCMLMSPISVAQYIDPAYPKFDLVIFDEASQLPTCEAVGTIARGENVVVVGDPKQLPPTSFFSSNRADEENYDKEDLESLLDDCLALSMPEEHLLWHYRSRHESLIAFSNMKYYDNKLFTFPSPNDLVSEVKWIPVEGFYDKGNTKQNQAEADAVVREIVRRLKDKELRKDSIGVVTFSSVQQILIDDMLMEEFRKNSELEKINNESSEPIFIKNLENVQGDERDVILFSVGYGPDKEGKVSMNFGPINRDGGWRRLNVAISRARKHMLVYSTLKPEQIDLARTRSEGVAGLKGFLEFAARGKNTLAVKNGTQKEKNIDILRVISERIREMGYDVKCNIGCSGYKIDIGVVNPKNPDTYILGIMCDGENYKMASTARDRNVLQPSVLTGLGWNIVHVWVLDWLDSQDKVLKKIKTTIEQAMSGVEKSIEDSSKIKADDWDFEKVSYEEEALNKASDYQTAVIRVRGMQENFYDPMSTGQIADCIHEIIMKEAPVSKKLMYKKVLSAWTISRSGNRVEAVLDKVVRSMNVKMTTSGGIPFYWRVDQNPADYSEYRIAKNDGEKRSMDDICAEEIANAIKAVAEAQISLSKTDLIRETAKLFGFTRLGNIIEVSVERGLSEAQRRGMVDISDDGERITLRD